MESKIKPCSTKDFNFYTAYSIGDYYFVNKIRNEDDKIKIIIKMEDKKDNNKTPSKKIQN